MASFLRTRRKIDLDRECESANITFLRCRCLFDDREKGTSLHEERDRLI